MDVALNYLELKAFVMALAYTQPRTLAMMMVLPIFNSQLMPNMLRMGVAAGAGFIVAPVLMPFMSKETLAGGELLLVIVKEAFVGFVLGYLIAIPFWAFEAIGFFIDNQRGASIAATLNPLTGNDTSPLGILFNQAFIVYFFISGGFLLMLGLLYDSYQLWPVFDWVPVLRSETIPLLVAQLDKLVRVALLLGAPVIVAMFLSEMGLALVSRFVPQLQVFFLAMPIKSALALLVLIVYMSTLFDYALDHIEALRGVVVFLNEHWHMPGAPR